MESIVGIVDTEIEARRVAAEILRADRHARVRVFTPHDRPEELVELPTDEAEQPGMGAAIGAVTGGATTAEVASLLVPPAGVIAIAGIAVGALVGILGGAATGHAVEETFSFGLPRDEIFVYANALRDGRYVVIAWVDGDAAAARIRRVLQAAHVTSIDAARDEWWIGLRDREAAAYGERFAADEATYRRGFEAGCRGDDVATLGDVARDRAFQEGFARGRAYAGAETAAHVPPSAPA